MKYRKIRFLADKNDLGYCPFCGAELEKYHKDGSCECGDCERRFGVIEIEAGEEGEENEKTVDQEGNIENRKTDFV